MYLENRIQLQIKQVKINIVTKSLNENKECIGYLSKAPDTIWIITSIMCSAIRWANANAANKNGKTKCREKNLLV